MSRVTGLLLLLVTRSSFCPALASESTLPSKQEESFAAGKRATRSRQFNKAHRQFDIAISEAEKEEGELKEFELICSLEAKADAFDLQHEFEKADPLKLRALSIAEHYYGPENPLFATCIMCHANRFLRHGKYRMAECLFRRSLVIREKLFQHRAELAWDLAGLGKSLEGQGNYAEAEKLYVRCLKIYFPDAGELYLRLRNLGRCYLAQGRKNEARAFLQRATQLERESKDIARAVAIGNLANRKCGLKKYQESEALFKRALAIVSKYDGPHREHEQLLRMYASLLEETARLEAAKTAKIRADEVGAACDAVARVETGLVFQ